MNLLGAKDSEGSATAINYACMQTPEQQVITVMFDEQKRPIRLSNGENSIIVLDWNAKTISAISGTLTCPQAIAQPDAKISKTISNAKMTQQQCKTVADSLEKISNQCDIASFVSSALAVGATATGVGVAAAPALALGAGIFNTVGDFANLTKIFGFNNCDSIESVWAFEWTTDYGDTIKGTLTFSGTISPYPKTDSFGHVTERHQGVESELTFTGSYNIPAKTNTIDFSLDQDTSFQGTILNENAMSGTFWGYSSGHWYAQRQQ